MNPPTVPESPGTLRIQLDQLAKGLRRAVMFPRGAPLLKRPKGMKPYQDAEGNTFIYNPKLTSVPEIDRASAEHHLPQLLGATDGGMGAPDKSKLGAAMAVVARDRGGETTQSTATDRSHAAETVKQTSKLAPAGGSVSVEPPAGELAHRIHEAQGNVELNRGTSDIPLTDAGRKQAEQLAMQVGQVDAIYYGPLDRTKETAEIVAAAQPRRVPMIEVPGLRPPAEGTLEGQPKSQTKPITDDLKTAHPDVQAPGQGPLSDFPGESYHQWWLGTVFPALQPILAKYKANQKLRLLLVTHSRDLNAIGAWAAAGAPPDGRLDPAALMQDPPDTGAVQRLFLTSADAWAIDSNVKQPGILLGRHGETEWNQDASDASKPAPAPGAHEYSSTQVNLPYPLAGRVRRAGLQIPDEDLADDGRENEPHVTLKYGLHGEDPEPVRKLLENEPPIRLTLGKTSVFPANESKTARGGAGSADVVKADVHSPDLHRLHKKISAALPHTDTHPDYKPHATLAYVKPGKGKKYAGSKAVEGFRAVVDHVTFSSKNGQKTRIPLAGGKQPKPQSAKDQAKEQITGLVKAGQHRQAYELASRATAAKQLNDDDVDHAIDRAQMPRHLADAIHTNRASSLRQILDREFDKLPAEQQTVILQRIRQKPDLLRSLLQSVA